jgi:hypothetical protein
MTGNHLPGGQPGARLHDSLRYSSAALAPLKYARVMVGWLANNLSKLLTTRLFGWIAESALPIRRQACSASQRATPWDRSAASRLSYGALGSKPKSSLVICQHRVARFEQLRAGIRSHA